MTEPMLFPLVVWDRINVREADNALVCWGHFLGACNRPFARQAFGLYFAGQLVAVAVSASTVNATCGGYGRQECLELARLCSHPDHRDLTRVTIRLWRKTAAQAWHYWPVRAYVSYANAARHSGDIYRFDGWRNVKDVPGGVAGGGWQRGKKYEAKSIYAFELAQELVTKVELSVSLKNKENDRERE